MKPVNEFDVFSCPLYGWRLIEASAGTGKTWNIGGLYLRLLLEKKREVREILVVTFTRAATDELRDRIRSRIGRALAYLEGRAADTDDGFVEKLLEKRMAAGDDPQEMTALLRLAFQSFDQAAIFTIHSFCQRALALSAFSSGQAFSVKAEADDSELVREAVNDFWRRHVAGGRLSPALSAWLEKKRFTPDRLEALLRRHLARPLATVKWPETAPEAPEAAEDGSGKLEATFHMAASCWTSEKETVKALLKDAAERNVLYRNRYKAPAIESAARAFDRFFAAGNAFAMIGNTAKTELMADTRLSGSTKKGQTVPRHPFFGMADRLIETCRKRENALEAARYGLLKRFLAEATVSLKEKKRERRTIAFDDMLANLYEALNDPGMPWLAEAVRMQFPAALIDEFQDTDPLQYAIFSAVYREPESPVFLVGDPKQAIYSFRNADLHTYFAARENLDALARYSLAENHRSVPELIAACNTLFSVNKRAFLQDGLDFVPVRPGKRELPVLTDESGDGPGPFPALCVWMLGQENGEWLKRSAARKQALEAMADEVARLINAGKAGKLAIGGRPAGAGDVAVLVRSHREAAMVRQALARRGIGSVSLSQESVFQSREARELECLLFAMLTPDDESLLMAAVSTEMIGLDAGAIEALAGDEAALSGWIGRFGQYRRAWRENGAACALRWLIHREGVVSRLLAFADGERRLTNLMHLLELVGRESGTENAPDSLMRWYAERREGKKKAEEEELRLETDRHLVQVMTLHRSKGLEFPFVFCPLLWDNFPRRGNETGEGLEYHEGHATVVDYRKLADDEQETVRKNAALERAAEDMRLIYVALTRAVYRCYLVAGCYVRVTRRGESETKTTTESRKSLLNWLVAGDGFAPPDWLAAKDGKKEETVLLPEPEQIGSAWESLASRCPHIAVTALPDSVGATVDASDETATLLTAARFDKTVGTGWRMNSFSGLMRNAVDDTETGDHDERALFAGLSGLSENRPEALPANDILLFPKGTYAGSCLHAVFENADFTDESTWEKAVESALKQFPQRVGGKLLSGAEEGQAVLKGRALKMLGDVMATPLPDGICLGNVGNGRRLTEWPFCLAAARLSAKRLNRLVKKSGYAVPELAFDDMTAYLNGFVDLVFEMDGRFYLLDWKSNHLGYRPEDYGIARIETEMAEHGYHWQYLLYTVALHRYLSGRLPDYDYGRHFGGVFYLFVRGVRPDWKNGDGTPSGVFFHKPGQETVEAIDRLLKQPGFADGGKHA
ncbi:exodeoxyribonuclease V subunit beta [Oxalobacter paraformigenes]|uniref:RecBCD enzyme subunit RecB n=1 Tax=Oxalobacter paraformigenes TaxID=556268 RepID=C3X2X2_9BURK|nr:exodeoxyribonuclease V subunit beta [Oxalobacter paraformigenes]EEO27558.1 exodeoxyribonuclease V, beta subunit [Oxalobacter paraformigenes]